MVREARGADARSDGDDYSAGRSNDRSGAAGNVRADTELRGGDGLAFFRADGELYFRVSRPGETQDGRWCRRGPRGRISSAGTSVDHSYFHRGGVARNRQY